MTRRFLGGALLLVVLSAGQPCLAATAKRTEAELIRMLGSSNPSTIIEALDRLPVWYPTSTNAVPIIKDLLGNRAVTRRAALALADYHAELALEEVRQVLGLLRSPDANEAMDGLKALRGLKEPEALRARAAAETAPLLQDKEIHVIRDACRTLAVIGNRDVIPKLEPLLKHSRADVREDAQKAIAAIAARP